MSTIKSSDEHLTLNADGSSKDIKFQANGVEKASISSAGAFTSTTIDATKLTGNLPAISGASLTGVADATKVPLAGGTMTGNLLVESSASANTVVRSKGTAADGYRHGFEAVNGHTGGETWSMFSTNNSDSVFGGGKLVFSTGAAGSASASTRKLQINSSGYITMPNQPSCSVSRGTGQGTGLIQWDYVNYNTGSHYSTSTSRFTAPVAGKYLVNIFGMSNNDNTTMDIEVKINGNGNNILVPYEAANGANFHQVSGSNIFGLSANDYLTVHIGTGSWYGTTAGRHNGFSVHLLS